MGVCNALCLGLSAGSGEGAEEIEQPVAFAWLGDAETGLASNGLLVGWIEHKREYFMTMKFQGIPVLFLN